MTDKEDERPSTATRGQMLLEIEAARAGHPDIEKPPSVKVTSPPTGTILNLMKPVSPRIRCGKSVHAPTGRDGKVRAAAIWLRSIRAPTKSRSSRSAKWKLQASSAGDLIRILESLPAERRREHSA